jgi:hypothetical protein
MIRITVAQERLAAATYLPGVLDAAYDAFEDMLAVLRRHQEDEEASFAAFVFAACSAANGRDWIGGAPALPPTAPRDRGGDLLEAAAVHDVALAIAVLSDELATRLADSAETTANPKDRSCCEHAVAEAATIRALMGGASPP